MKLVFNKEIRKPREESQVLSLKTTIVTVYGFMFHVGRKVARNT